MNTEEQEEEARREQGRRDQQIPSSKRRKGSGGQSFSRPRWEQSRQQWDAETPTAAKRSAPSYTHQPSWEENGKGRGKNGYGDSFPDSRDMRPHNDSGKSKGAGKGRRWEAGRQAIDPEVKILCTGADCLA